MRPWYPCLHSLVSFSAAVLTFPDKSNLREKGLFLAHSLRVESTTAHESARSLKLSDCIHGGKHRAMSSCSAHFLNFTQSKIPCWGKKYYLQLRCLSTSFNTVKMIPHRSAQRPDFQVSLDAVKLIWTLATTLQYLDISSLNLSRLLNTGNLLHVRKKR